MGVTDGLRRVQEENQGGPGSEGPGASVEWFLESQRGKMTRTLDHLLRVARREARRRTCPSSLRLKWVKAICYITQTYNSVLRDADYDQLRREMTAIQEKVKKLGNEKPQKPGEVPPADQQQAGQSNGTVEAPGPG